MDTKLMSGFVDFRSDREAVSREQHSRQMAICVYCRHNLKERCQSECQPEGRYRWLEPDTLPDWETPPSLPAFRDLAAMSATERLAIIWLVLHYLDQAHKRE